jgi:hypothetical protein
VWGQRQQDSGCGAERAPAKARNNWMHGTHFCETVISAEIANGERPSITAAARSTRDPRYVTGQHPAIPGITD